MDPEGVVQHLHDSDRVTEPATEAERMANRLQKYRMREKNISPDGNCQMRAIADQLFGDQEKHNEVRRNVVQWLQSNEKFPVDETGSTTLSEFLDRDQFPTWRHYCDYMARDRAWGDHMTLLAAAQVYHARIWVLSNVDSDDSQCVSVINPIPSPASLRGNAKTNQVRDVRLSHWAELHYNSLYPVDNDSELHHVSTGPPGSAPAA